MVDISDAAAAIVKALKKGGKIDYDKAVDMLLEDFDMPRPAAMSMIKRAEQRVKDGMA